MLGNEPRHAKGLRTSDTGQTLETYHPETTHLTDTRSCEACSAFTQIAARTLAPSPICDRLHRRLQPFRHLHDCSGRLRRDRSPGGPRTHWKAPPSHGAHVEQTSQTVDRFAQRVAPVFSAAVCPPGRCAEGHDHDETRFSSPADANHRSCVNAVSEHQVRGIIFLSYDCNERERRLGSMAGFYALWIRYSDRMVFPYADASYVNENASV